MSFQALYDEVMAGSERFGHRQHVHVTWLAVRRFGTAEAITVVSDGIQETARYAGAPQKYHATVSRAWVEVVGYHAAEHRADGFDGFDVFDDFAASNPALLDKRLLSRFYSSALLASAGARAGWVEPDREPFPWTVNR
ncbi:hypothetical protein [Catenulispora pinisilvae]|uniref:hypothetical protein n=1 Tax=Catenulispora pinisilvae TaxID=2705253 RepID=UPI0018915A70|nr:hypothetical protein [Catenulispora pinisilvae]